jgi:AcrR family transcriptional regulator
MSLLIRAPRPGYPRRVAPLPDHLMPVPVGKKRLAKEVLKGHQRERVLSAAVAVFSRNGYQATTVADLVGAAQIGVGGFYSLFAGKEDCFLSLYDRIVADARERIAAGVDEDDRWPDRILTGLRTLLELIAAEPDRARIVIVEANAAGAAAEERYLETVAELTAAVREGRSDGVGEALRPSFEDAAVGGLAWILHQRLAAGEPVDVEELLPELASVVVGPFEKA